MIELKPCPCCDNKTITELGGFEICDVCHWEDDPVQADDKDYFPGANKESLNQARARWNALKQAERPAPDAGAAKPVAWMSEGAKGSEDEFVVTDKNKSEMGSHYQSKFPIALCLQSDLTAALRERDEYKEALRHADRRLLDSDNQNSELRNHLVNSERRAHELQGRLDKVLAVPEPKSDPYNENDFTVKLQTDIRNYILGSMTCINAMRAAAKGS